ncbi:hypothetical protein Q31b_04110 [Novipirellula aureliae]|uniref:Uncharacterized protein n=1 Tax=Novipirellula aureliae TaxID=2527966 RepID=A0A5C6E8W6_9BACT|nr:hypothetical protein [Novipirellula aureliae]TWU45240.1 hypothetical protein Q31b_04110 [Novipirellula aureliae]
MNESQASSIGKVGTESVIEAKLANQDSVTTAAASESYLQSRMAVLGMLFLVTGALGIPLLWMNKRFSTRERVVWAVVVSIYTAALLYFTYILCMWSYHRIVGIA